MRFDNLDELRAYWAESKVQYPYAGCGTGSTDPPLFLSPHEWIFSPSKEALVSAVTRWDDFGIIPRWCDPFENEWKVHDKIERRRLARRNENVFQGRGARADENTFNTRPQELSEDALVGYWRITRLPCGLSHFDWFSELASVPNDPTLATEVVASIMKLITFDDWWRHQTQDGVQFLVGSEIEADIEFWMEERRQGRAPYEGI